MDKVDKMSDRDVRALKRQQAVLEQERKELLERVARQKTRIDSLEKKEENRSKNETTVRQTQGPLQEANGAASKQAEGAERLQKQAAESPTRPRKPESLQAELYRWLHSKTSSQDENTQGSPMLLRSPGSIKSLPCSRMMKASQKMKTWQEKNMYRTGHFRQRKASVLE